MLAVAYGALRARRSQSLLLALLAGLLAAGAAAAPVLAVVAADQVRRHDLAAAPVNQRYVVVSTPVELSSGGAAVDNFDTQLRRLLPAPGFERYAGLRMDGYAQRSPAPDDYLQVAVAARDGV